MVAVLYIDLALWGDVEASGGSRLPLGGAAAG